MSKRVILVCICILSLAVGLAWAGEAAKSTSAAAPKAAPAMDMTAMHAEMMKCAVCKNMAPHMASIGPVMTMDVAKLNDGVAMMHGVSDPAKAAEFHAMCAEMHKAGQATMTMTDEQAASSLCTFCQDIRSAMKAGARMSTGSTKTGEVMVMTSSDPTVQVKLADLATKCEMMSASM